MNEQPSNKYLSNLPTNNKPLGEILAEAGLISIHQIETALYEQKQHRVKIGEILASHGWIKQETADFFAVKWSAILQKTTRRPLTLYLHAADLLDRQQLQSLKQIQLQNGSDLHLHEIAVEQGYVRQRTVDFFLKHLFNIEENQHLSFTKPYEIIKEYIYSGKTEFVGLELSQIPLNGVSLKKIKLDRSILIQANLNSSNLKNSSLVRTNLMLANLESANFSHVNFTKANLIEANLRKSNLEQANFQKANLQEADLRSANLRGASFVAADLRGTKLEADYSYDVYYDDRTRFCSSFSPTQAGWKKVAV